MMRLGFIAVLFTLGRGFSATIYTVTDLGSLGGDSLAYRVNNSGQAAGWSRTAEGSYHAALWSGGQMFDLGVGRAYGINDHGRVAGTAYATGSPQAALWNGPATVATASGEALDINDSGQVVGGNGHAFLASGRAVRDLGTLPGGSWSSAYGVNNHGVAAGYGDTPEGAFHAFLWSPGSGMIDLGTLGGANSYAMDINDNVQVAGTAMTVGGWFRAFFYSDGVMRDLGTLGGFSSFAYGINSRGDVVGFSWVAGSEEATRAFLYHNGAMDDLNALIEPQTGWQLREAYGINDRGQIVGQGMHDGSLRAFLLDPQPLATPEPGTAVLAVIGVALILAGARRRR